MKPTTIIITGLVLSVLLLGCTLVPRSGASTAPQSDLQAESSVLEQDTRELEELSQDVDLDLDLTEFDQLELE